MPLKGGGRITLLRRAGTWSPALFGRRAAGETPTALSVFSGREAKIGGRRFSAPGHGLCGFTGRLRPYGGAQGSASGGVQTRHAFSGDFSTQKRAPACFTYGTRKTGPWLSTLCCAQTVAPENGAFPCSDAVSQTKGHPRHGRRHRCPSGAEEERIPAPLPVFLHACPDDR